MFDKRLRHLNFNFKDSIADITLLRIIILSTFVQPTKYTTIIVDIKETQLVAKKLIHPVGMLQNTM